MITLQNTQDGRYKYKGLLNKTHRTGDIGTKGYSAKHTELPVQRITLQNTQDSLCKGLLYKTHRMGDISTKGYSTKHTGREILVQRITQQNTQDRRSQC